VPPAVEKAIKDGMKNLIEVPVESGSIPHRVEGFSGTAKVIMLPASPGTGIIAGAAVRAVCESAGIRDVLTKAHGSTNPVNLVKATLEALKQLRTRSEVERLRGLGGQSHRQARGPCAHRQCGHKKRTATAEESRATHGTYSSGLPASPTLRPKAGDRGPKGRSAGRLRTV
jgi:hypothetical protein